MNQPSESVLPSSPLPNAWSQSNVQNSREILPSLMQSVSFETSNSLVQGNDSLVTLPGDTASNISQVAIA